jgi:hypothetical protein
LRLPATFAVAAAPPTSPPQQGDQFPARVRGEWPLTTVIQRNPTDANGYNARGTASGQAGSPRGDCRFRHGDQANPSLPGLANRAPVQRRLRRDDLALADYNRALQTN